VYNVFGEEECCVFVDLRVQETVLGQEMEVQEMAWGQEMEAKNHMFLLSVSMCHFDLSPEPCTNCRRGQPGSWFWSMHQIRAAHACRYCRDVEMGSTQ